MRINILFGGKAGQGPNILSDLVSQALVRAGYYVFYSRDYQSIIRGGHNFNLVSFSENPIMSNHKGVDILVALDEKTKEIHQKECTKKTIILEGAQSNMYFAGSVFKILGFDFKELDILLKELEKRYAENIKEAKLGFENEKNSIKLVPTIKKKLFLMNGNQAIAKGALSAGLEFYYAYPMTPATGVLTELSQEMLNPSNKHFSLELENEIGVINAAIGSALTGAKAMVGTSGGGFDLMTEAISLTGIAEVPLVLYLSQRPGPATGVATYTGQGDLNMARHCGHGEFSRLLVAPGDTKESIRLTTEAFYFAHKYRIPAIIIGDKHLAESKFTYEGAPKLTESKKSISVGERFNSYEAGKEMAATDVPEVISKRVEARLKKAKELTKEVQDFETCKTYGNQESKDLVVSWGSTKGAILDAIQDPSIDCKFLQILYLEPFSEQAKQEISKAEKIIVIENNATSPLSSLIAEKTDRIIQDDHKILKYNARPFTCTEVANKLKQILA